jgi:hypothetical protein
MRKLRHVTIPDTHDRIPDMRPEGVEMIAQAATDKLQDTIRTLVRGILLADEQWTVYYNVKDELLERGEWSEELSRVGGKASHRR